MTSRAISTSSCSGTTVPVPGRVFPRQPDPLRPRAVHVEKRFVAAVAPRAVEVGSNLFHIGILGIFGGHFTGLLTPLQVWHASA